MACARSGGRPRSLLRLALDLFVLSIPCSGQAQSISTSTPVPPLQWLNLTSLLSGSPAPPLKDPSIGYDETSRTLLIFGGESQGGFPQSQTYLLDLDTLTWSIPHPPGLLTSTPPARSAAVGGGDFAASYREAHIIIGGKGNGSQPLSDVWAFDYNNHFWSQVSVTPGGPARLDAVGGIDITVPFDPSGSQGPTNTFYLMGGTQSSGSALSAVPLSETWQLSISGTLSANLPNSVVGSWVQQTIGNEPAVSGQGGTVLKQQLVSYGGCTNTASPNTSCVQGGSYVIDVADGTAIAPAGCATPRLGAAVVPNMNGFSSGFNTQVFVLLGLFDTSAWNDGGGLAKGEVDVLDIMGGSWSRVLPAGDPGQSGGTPTFPPPREGAAAIAISSGLVGSPRNAFSDTIVFGGRDAAGNYLSDMWLLRAYNASLSQSNQQWSGFGNGQLQTGVNANGQGVSVQYLTSCASAITSKPTSHTSSASSGTPTGSPSTTSPSTTSPPPSNVTLPTYNISLTHKILAPVSIVLLLPAIILYRLSLPSTTTLQSSSNASSLTFMSGLAVLVAYGIGIAGLTSSFTSISRPGSGALTKRGPPPNTVLKTAHGQAGLALFVALYGLIPVLFLSYFVWQRLAFSARNGRPLSLRPERRRADSTDTAEKLNAFKPSTDATGQSNVGPSRATSPPPGHTPSKAKARSWGASFFLHRDGRASSESAAETEATNGHRPFEVVNRPARVRHASTSGTINLSDSSHRMPPRNLSELSWLDRRRSVNAVGELDYALSQLNNRPTPSTPATAEVLMQHLPSPQARRAVMPPTVEIVLHSLLHALILGMCVFTLIALWSRAPRATFAVFLAWMAVFYITLLGLAWNGRPQNSTLTVLVSRLRGDVQFTAVPTATPIASRPMSMSGTTDHLPFQTEGRGPYLHQPPFQAAPHEEDVYSTSHGPLSDGEVSEEDEDTRQRRIEDEIGRRDVSIITVPKRKLWITNPS
ncbi:hypothetical protein BV25DRAFT_1817611 [Artomyces pyxidatus]|uniref:Uncharacterized protein n=1 Tax=Artomyces pyxidatus TaxID=48021 RepID=A0ACB8TJU3_9AGAM|nr:hypothetical protein BV25DRAFT_1817611 [Artomyces pyxidatus]